MVTVILLLSKIISNLPVIPQHPNGTLPALHVFHSELNGLVASTPCYVSPTRLVIPSDSDMEEKSVCCASKRAKEPQPFNCCPHVLPPACPMTVPACCTTDGTWRENAELQPTKTEPRRERSRRSTRLQHSFEHLQCSSLEKRLLERDSQTDR